MAMTKCLIAFDSGVAGFVCERFCAEAGLIEPHQRKVSGNDASQTSQEASCCRLQHKAQGFSLTLQHHTHLVTPLSQHLAGLMSSLLPVWIVVFNSRELGERYSTDNITSN